MALQNNALQSPKLGDGSNIFNSGTQVISSAAVAKVTFTAGDASSHSGHMTKKVTIDFNDVAALGAFTTGDVIFDTLPAGAVLEFARLKHSVLFVGPSITAMTARIQTANNNYGTGTLDVVGVAIGTTSGTSFINDVTGATENIAVATPIYVHFAATGANLSVMTAGSLDVWYQYRILS